MTAIEQNNLRMARTKAVLQESETARQEALARFVVSIAQMGVDLKRLVDLRREGQQGLDEMITYLDAKIRDFYRECFGTELGEG